MDSELTPFEKENVEQRLADDPVFWDLLQKLRQQDLCLRDAVSEIEKTPLPASLANLLTSPANDDSNPDNPGNVVSLPKGQTRRAKFFSALRFPAVAAAVVLASLLVVKQTSDDTVDVSPSVAQNPQVPIHISQALSSIVAGTTLHLESGKVTEILAYMRKDGTLCKHYTERNKNVSYEAVSCYEKGNWINPVATAAVFPSLSGDQYAPAAGSNSTVNKYIENTIDGTSLTIEQERVMMDLKLK